MHWKFSESLSVGVSSSSDELVCNSSDLTTILIFRVVDLGSDVLLLLVLVVDNVDDLLDDESHSQHVDLLLVFFRLEEVHLREVHAAGLWEEGLEESHHELERNALTFGGASGTEFALVDTIDVERDPVGGALAIGEEVFVDLLLHFGKTVWVADS